MPARISNQIEKRICFLYVNENVGTTNLGKQFNIDPNTVRSILKRNGIKLRSNHCLMDNSKYIIKEYLKGRNQDEIALDFNTWNTSIRRVLLANNIPLRSTADINRKVKINPFEAIEDEYVQYWIGYIAADGNIAKDRAYIRVNSGKSDKDHLDLYASWLGKDVNVTTSFNKKYKIPEYCVGFTNQEAKDSLISYGITPAKSKTLQFKIPLTWHMLRGIFDGDGCITDGGSKVSICTGSQAFAIQLTNYLCAQGILVRLYKGTVWIITIRSVSLDLFAEKLYNNAKIFLIRKYLLFEPLLKKQN